LQITSWLDNIKSWSKRLLAEGIAEVLSCEAIQELREFACREKL